MVKLKFNGKRLRRIFAKIYDRYIGTSIFDDDVWKEFAAKLEKVQTNRIKRRKVNGK